MTYQHPTTPLLDLDLTTPSTQALPTALVDTITGLTWASMWKFNQSSGAPTTLGPFALVQVGSPRFERKVPCWDGSSMIGMRAIEFLGTSTTCGMASPNGTDWDLTQSLTFVALIRVARIHGSDRGLFSKRNGTTDAGFMVRLSNGLPVLQVGDGSTTTQCFTPTVANEIDGIPNGSLQWVAFAMNLTTGYMQVHAYRDSGTAVLMPAGSKSNVAAGFRFGGMPVLFDPEATQIVWAGALVGAQAEAFTLAHLNLLDSLNDRPSIFPTYVRNSVTSPRVAYESGFGLRVQHCHGSASTANLCHFPHAYHASATESAQKLGAYFDRGTTVYGPNHRNQYVRSDDLNHASWVKSNITTAPNAAEDPAGFTAASQLTASSANGTISQTISVTANRAQAHSFYVRRAGGSDVSLKLRAVDTSDSSVVGVSTVTATSEWIRISLVTQSLTATSVRYELEIVANAATIYATFAQMEYGWPTEYQPQRGTLVDRDDPECYISNTSNVYYDPAGGRVEAVVCQYHDNATEDQYVFSTGLSVDATANSDRMLMQISDHNGTGAFVVGTVEEPYGLDIQHHDSSGVMVAQLGNYNIDRNAEITYAYDWDSAVSDPAVNRRGYVEQTSSATSSTGPTIPFRSWSVTGTMPRLYPGSRYTYTTALEGMLERLTIYGRHAERLTTIARIRDRIVMVISALTPTSLSGDKFRAYRNEGNGDFIEWVTANPQASLRRFQVRQLSFPTEPDISNTDMERVQVILGLVVAYPQSHRYGAQNALDRDDVMTEDLKQIEYALGPAGASNFQLQNPNATFVGRTVDQIREGAPGVDAIQMAITFEFSRSTT